MDNIENILTHETIKKIKSEVDNSPILKKLIEEYPIDNLLDFNEFNVKEKLQHNAFVQEQFRLIYISEKRSYNKLEEKLSKLTGERYDYYKYKNNKALSKTEIERYYLPKDENLDRLKQLLQLQEVKVAFFESMADAFKAQGFNMKTFVENLKIGG